MMFHKKPAAVPLALALAAALSVDITMKQKDY